MAFRTVYILKRSQQTKHVSEPCKDNHEVKNLMATSKDVKLYWGPTFWYLASD